jgi:membrane-bound lytic murein transglycosylase B
VDLWSDWADIMGSVANYFTAHDWQRGGKIATRIDGQIPENLLSDGLALDRTGSQLAPYGVDAEDHEKLMVFSLESEDGPEFWVGYNNFFVITRYNRNNMYAMAVHDLGRSVRDRIDAGDSAGPAAGK